MVPVTRSLLSLAGRSIRPVMTRQAHHRAGPDFHDKYGTVILLAGTTFCVGIWSFVSTQTGITWNFSPVGKVTPQEWRED
uniref:Cytochrome c oxidase subunit 7B, mitochondrial n=1 Tax=Callorhinchus milii TaxID=7868 RepID=V9LI82_CALMI